MKPTKQHAGLEAAVVAVNVAHSAFEGSRLAPGAQRTTAAAYRAATTERALVLAKHNLEAERLAARRIGVGADEERAHPEAFGAAGLRAAMAPVAERRLAHERAIAEADAEAAAIVAATVARRAEVAADPTRHPGLGAPAPVPTGVYQVLLERAHQEAAGRQDAEAIARAAGWLVLGFQCGDVPPDLRRDHAALVEAALVGVRPVVRDDTRLHELNHQIGKLELRAAQEAEQAAERAEAEQARARRAQNDAEAQTAANARAAKERAEAEQAAEARRAAGRRALGAA